MMQDGMLAFAEHYGRMQRMHPHDRLQVVFEIDGAILDLRYPICQLLPIGWRFNRLTDR